MLWILEFCRYWKNLDIGYLNYKKKNLGIGVLKRKKTQFNFGKSKICYVNSKKMKVQLVECFKNQN